MGETGRRLGTRIEVHMRALRNPSRPSYVDLPMTRHRVSAHHRKIPEVGIQILDIEHGTMRRKVLEGIWIPRLRPEINIKKEKEEALKFAH